MKRINSELSAKKSLGQHFLNNARVPALMADAGEVQKGDIVLEIGPGTGVLTRELLARGAHVIAVEADERAIAVLNVAFAADIGTKKLILHHLDVRTLDVAKIGLKHSNYKVVANIPYYLSGMLFRQFLETDIQPTTLVFLVQKEVADRIAKDKKESLLSLSVKVFGMPVYVKTVRKGNFTPPPKVDSAIIAIKHVGDTHLESLDINREFFFAMLHEGFKSKRKQLIPNLSTIFRRQTLEKVFFDLALSLKVRGEDLSIEQWLQLCKKLKDEQSTS
jgi:16S rRNA (adenine1518-N6/adenine1519-N6)-dimethyltransferase